MIVGTFLNQTTRTRPAFLKLAEPRLLEDSLSRHLFFCDLSMLLKMHRPRVHLPHTKVFMTEGQAYAR